MEYSRFLMVSERYHRRFGRWNHFKSRCLRRYFNLYHRLEVRGLENIPEGPVLLAANHGGGFDIDVIALSQMGHPSRKIEVMIADSWHYVNSWWGRLAVGNGIPTPTRGGLDYDYLDPLLTASGSKCDKMVAIFPEGDQGLFRQRHLLRPFFPGVARIAVKYGIPIVPVAMAGFNRASPILYDIPKDHAPADPIVMVPPIPLKLVIEYGAPIYLNEYGDQDLPRAEAYRLANHRVRPALADLLRRYQRVESVPVVV